MNYVPVGGKGGGAVAVTAAVLPATGASWSIPVSIALVAILVVWGIVYVTRAQA